MDRLYATVILMIGTLGLATIAPATALTERAHAAELVRRADMVQGVVMMAGNSHLMIVPDAGDISEFVVGPNARITRDGQTTQLEALQAKDQVVVMCNGDGPARTAIEIVARSPL
jgi:hypothetical protein